MRGVLEKKEGLIKTYATQAKIIADVGMWWNEFLREKNKRELLSDPLKFKEFRFASFTVLCGVGFLTGIIYAIISGAFFHSLWGFLIGLGITVISNFIWNKFAGSFLS